ncbi:MAG: hypothetical protein EHM58_04260 [Ignavibacteriae bacterium]|nr:MAG: hypothetical protein EHM58_04260 [Ignavibacteriota bacterium]
MKKIFQHVFKIHYVRTLVILLLLSLPFTGSDCEKTLTPSGDGELTGQWRLVYNSGTNHDICPGEVVTFLSNGEAQLQCPNQLAVTRHYTVSNNSLTYTESGIEYNIVSLTANELQLSGYDRFLYYSKTAISDNKNYTGSGNDNRHSSER